MLAAMLPAAAGEGDSTTWYRIATVSGTPIGYASEQVVVRADGRDVVYVQHVDVDQPGGDQSPAAELFSVRHPVHMFWRTTLKLDGAGRVFALATFTENGPNWSRDEIRIEAGNAVVVHRTRDGTTNSTIALPPDVRFDGGDGLLAAWNPQATPRLAFDDFNAGALAVDHVTIEAAANGPLVALRKRYAGGVLVSISRLTLDDSHRIVSAAQAMFGADVETRVTDRQSALAPHPPYQPLPDSMTKSPYCMSDDAIRGHIRYRFSFRDGIEFPLPETGEQRVTVAAGAATVDICEGCGPGLASDARALAEARRPTVWLESDAPAIVAIAAAANAPGLSDTKKMEILTRKTAAYLPRVDFIGHYTALQALKRGAGDCTESAALLAALGRAAGIATRVVNGLVYSRERYHGVSNVFLPHSWVLAYVDGHWKSFDAALAEFDSTHIAITISDGDERTASAAHQLAGLLVWDQMQEVRARPAP